MQLHGRAAQPSLPVHAGKALPATREHPSIAQQPLLVRAFQIRQRWCTYLWLKQPFYCTVYCIV